MHTIFLRGLILFSFWSSFRFIAKTSRKYRGLLYIPRLHKCRHSSPISIPYQSDIFVTDELTLTHPYHPKSIVYSSVYSVLYWIHSMGLDKCIMVYTHHCTIIQSIFTALKFLCVLPIHPFPLISTSSNHRSFYCLCSFAFPECHIAGIIQYAAFPD